MLSYGNRRIVERRLKENVDRIEQESKSVELATLDYLKCLDKDLEKVL